jgi:hypothetical protein
MSVLEDGIPQAEHDAAVARARSEGHNEGLAAGRREGETIGAAAAYERIGSILSNDKVKGKEALAVDLACKSPAMSVDSVVGFIERIPGAAAAAGPGIRERIAATGVNAVEPGAPAATASGNAGATDADKERAEQLAKIRAEESAKVNASRGYTRPN